MSRTFRRILLASAISISCFCATLFWYHSTKPKLQFQSESGIKIAEIISFQHDVAKRPLRRLVWKAMSSGDILFDGEAIKTAANSEARIRFLNNDSILDIEPNSLIVLELSDDQISLDLLEGGLFVKSKSLDKKAVSITLKTDKGKIELTNTEASLSRKKGQAVNLQVLAGQAKVEVDGKKQILKKGNSGRLDGKKIKIIKSTVEIISPKPLQTVYMNPEQPEKMKFKFKPLPKGQSVEIQIGQNRAEMETLLGIRSKGDTGVLKAPVKVGRYFWKLIVKEKNKIVAESPTLRMSVKALMPPIPFAPVVDQIIRVKDLPHSIDFQWSGSEAYESVKLQLSESRNFDKQLLHRSENEGLAQATLDKPGEYFWRLIGHKNKKQIISKTQSFKLFKLAILEAPELIHPPHLSEFYKPDLKDGSVPLRWTAVKEAEGYEVRILLTRSNGKLVEQTYNTKSNKIKIPNALRGDYTWSITTLGKQQKRSVPSESSVFALKGYPEIAWLSRVKPDIYEYVTAKPSAELHWEKGPRETIQYKLRLGRTKAELKNDPGKFISETEIIQEFPSNGKFKALIEAIDAAGFIIARSKLRTLMIREKPLLLAPMIEPESDGRITASKMGDYNLTWSDVDGAKEYLLELKNLKSKKLKIYKYNNAQGALKSLLPGEYEIQVRAIDISGRRGPASVKRDFNVPAKSSIKPPTLNLLEVAD